MQNLQDANDEHGQRRHGIVLQRLRIQEGSLSGLWEDGSGCQDKERDEDVFVSEMEGSRRSQSEKLGTAVGYWPTTKLDKEYIPQCCLQHLEGVCIISNL